MDNKFYLCDGAKIGCIVYLPRFPMKLGVVTRLDPPMEAVEVFWLVEEKSTMVSIFLLRNFEPRIKEAEEKAERLRRAYSVALMRAGKVIFK
jgi:hypothetical protein